MVNVKLDSNQTAGEIVQVKPSVLLAAEWLLYSDIQNVGMDPKLKGGISAWYDLRTGKHSFIYSEITGYAVNLFLFLHKVTGLPVYLERAKLAGNWLLRSRDNKYGLVVNRVYFDGDLQTYYDSWVFTFDQWVIIYGLCNLYEALQDIAYLNAAREIAESLTTRTFRHDGSFFPAFNLQTGTPEATNDKWSRESGSFHAKALMGLGSLYRLTGNETYLSKSRALVEFALNSQEMNGRFITQKNERSTHLHPHLYSLEGLFHFSVSCGDRTLLNACIRGLEWVFQEATINETVRSFFRDSNFFPYERTDILAQTLRLGVIALGYSDFKGSGLLAQLRDKLLSYQVKHGQQGGGFFYGQEQDGAIHYHLNVWATMFAVQALQLYDQWQDGGPKYDFNFFV